MKVAFKKYSKVLCTVCNCFQIQIIKNSFEIQLSKQTNHNLLIQSSAFFILHFLDVKCIHQKKNSLAEFYIQFCCCDKQMQCPYNFVFVFLKTKIPILCQIFRRQQRYLMPLILTIFMTEFMRGVKLSSVFAKKYYRSYLLQWNLFFHFYS